MAERIFVSDTIWVELLHEHAIVSWVGGFKAISYEAPVADLLHLLSFAVKDTLGERPTHEQVQKDRETWFDKGWSAGWTARGEDLRESV